MDAPEIYMLGVDSLEFDPRLERVTVIPDLMERGLKKIKGAGDKRELYQAQILERTSEFAALVESIRKHGVREPLKVWTHRKKVLVADGRHRLLAAREAGIKEVPCVWVDKDDVLEIILDADTRRHFSKGALAYRAVLLCPEVATEASKRVKKGKPTLSTESTGLSQSALATRVGVSRDLIISACSLYRIFEKHADLRKTYEPTVWECSSIAKLLGEMEVQALAKENNLKVEVDEKAKADNELKKKINKLKGQFTSLPVRASQISENWGLADDEVKKAMCDGLSEFLSLLPKECFEVVAQLTNPSNE